MIQIRPEAKLTCSHCRVAFKSEWNVFDLGSDQDGEWRLFRTACVNCERVIALLRQYDLPALKRLTQINLPGELKNEWMVWPRTVSRAPIPTNVPKPIADEYHKAVRVLPDSSEASAALSRSCLQNLLVEKAAVKTQDLFDQIQEVIDARLLPSTLAEDLDAVRVIGNFGAHPIKSKNTGEIVPVEPGEAEWNLDVLDALFDFFYAQSEKRSDRRAALDAKLKAAGRPTFAEMRKEP